MPGTEVASAVAFDGDRLLIGGLGTITVIDVSNPAAATVARTLPAAGHVEWIAVPAPGRIVAGAYRGGLFQWQLP